MNSKKILKKVQKNFKQKDAELQKGKLKYRLRKVLEQEGKKEINYWKK